MIRKQFYIEQHHDRMLKRRARERGVTESALIREALAFMRSLSAAPQSTRGRKWTRASLYEDRIGRLAKSCREGEAVMPEPLVPETWPKGYWQRWGKASRDLDLIEPSASGGNPVDLDEP